MPELGNRCDSDDEDEVEVRKLTYTPVITEATAFKTPAKKFSLPALGSAKQRMEQRVEKLRASVKAKEKRVSFDGKNVNTSSKSQKPSPVETSTTPKNKPERKDSKLKSKRRRMMEKQLEESNSKVRCFCYNCHKHQHLDISY